MHRLASHAISDYSSAFGIDNDAIGIGSVPSATIAGLNTGAYGHRPLPCWRDYAVSVGQTGGEHRHPAADGTEDFDAVSVRQLRSLVTGSGGAAFVGGVSPRRRSAPGHELQQRGRRLCAGIRNTWLAAGAGGPQTRRSAKADRPRRSQVLGPAPAEGPRIRMGEQGRLGRQGRKVRAASRDSGSREPTRPWGNAKARWVRRVRPAQDGENADMTQVAQMVKPAMPPPLDATEGLRRAGDAAATLDAARPCGCRRAATPASAMPMLLQATARPPWPRPRRTPPPATQRR
jgi:hypothetical protein